MCSTGEYEFIVGQTPSCWPSNVQLSHAKRPGSVVEGQRACSRSEEGLIVGQTPSNSPSNGQLSHVKCSDSVAEVQRMYTTSEDGLLVRETSTYLTYGRMAGLNLRVVAVSVDSLWVKSPVIRRSTSSSLTSDVQSEVWRRLSTCHY